MNQKSAKTPLKDLKRFALEHYEDVSSVASIHFSEIPKAIEFYYDRLMEKEKLEKENYIDWSNSPNPEVEIDASGGNVHSFRNDYPIPDPAKQYIPSEEKEVLERLKIEKSDLHSKRMKLMRFIYKPKFKSLPEYQQSLMKLQNVAMYQYEDILENRINLLKKQIEENYGK